MGGPDSQPTWSLLSGGLRACAHAQWATLSLGGTKGQLHGVMQLHSTGYEDYYTWPISTAVPPCRAGPSSYSTLWGGVGLVERTEWLPKAPGRRLLGIQSLCSSILERHFQGPSAQQGYLLPSLGSSISGSSLLLRRPQSSHRVRKKQSQPTAGGCLHACFWMSYTSHAAHQF